MPRAPSSTKAKRGAGHSAALGSQIQADEAISKFGSVSAPGRRQKQKGSRQQDAADEANVASGSGMRITSAVAGQNSGSKFVDPKQSRTILRLAREQQQELEDEEAEAQQPALTERRAPPARTSSSDDEEEDDDIEQDDGELRSDEEYEEYEEYEIDPEDAALMERFAAQDAAEAEGGSDEPRNLGDIIMAKVQEAERQAAAQKQSAENQSIHERAPRQIAGSGPIPPGINPKVVEVYTSVGELLSRYKSGPLPKALKIIPTLKAWEDILYLTGPESWTPHSTLAVTRIFVSNFKPKKLQRFYELVLLDKVRNEIGETGKLSYQLYEAMKKALFKPAAFFKGILFPLCESGCTLKEAAILSSVLTRVSVPILHSAAAILRLAEMPYSPSTSLFLRVLLDKRYALPYKVLDSLVFHFLRFADADSGVERTADGGRRMPVIWFQCLLVFAQRYKNDLVDDQKAALLDLLRVQWHDGISPEVRRELKSAKSRGEMLDEPVDSDDDMMSV